MLSLFSDIRAGEGGTVVLLVLNAFIMMGLYYILKPAREGLILSGFGAVKTATKVEGEVKPINTEDAYLILEAASSETFVPGYLRLLARGGSARPVEILAEAGVEITDPAFWQGGFDAVEALVAELEAL